MSNKSVPFALSVAALSFSAVAVEAKEARNQGPPPAVVQSLLECRAMTDSAARLACYDRTATGVADAIAAKELVLIDKAKAVEVKRELFGYSAPNFAGLLGGGDLTQVEGVVASAYPGPDGWTVRLQDGSVWTQNDGAPIALSPRAGDKVTIKRGTLNSYFLRIGNQPGVKAHRIK
jgi:hypothetical protein